ncbi:hypothetical protein M092_3524 [Parabacteroides distasonis str. 3776 D15 iv]|nr:hypothetical protein M090_2795 [Parabacteroides distasonis str. 3776 Po2 i]KDS69343.1 hypothetical protein M092_3524 [Parabacteroides distasonis str. 3776 D15 iv]
MLNSKNKEKIRYEKDIISISTTFRCELYFLQQLFGYQY